MLNPFIEKFKIPNHHNYSNTILPAETGIHASLKYLVQYCTSTCPDQILIQQTLPATPWKYINRTFKTTIPLQPWKLIYPLKIDSWKCWKMIHDSCPFFKMVPFHFTNSFILPLIIPTLPLWSPETTEESDSVCVKLGVVDFLCIDLLPRSKKHQFCHLEDGIVASSRNAISWEENAEDPVLSV